MAEMQGTLVRFHVLTAASKKTMAFWDIAPCRLIVVDRRFRGAYCLHHNLRLYFSSERKVCSGILSPLKSIALAGFETATYGFSGKHTNHYTTKVTILSITIEEQDIQLEKCP
jgi:hypothetical protein